MVPRIFINIYFLFIYCLIIVMLHHHCNISINELNEYSMFTTAVDLTLNIF